MGITEHAERPGGGLGSDGGAQSSAGGQAPRQGKGKPRTGASGRVVHLQLGAGADRVTEDARPEPPYPADVRAKGWLFTLDMERIEQSETWELAPDNMRPWLLMLWARAWTGVPCGTLPASGPSLARRIGMDRATFEANDDVLLRGWYEASDGRLYHPVITELVEKMRDGRRYDRERKRIARAEAIVRVDKRDVRPDSNRSPGGVPPLEQEQEQEYRDTCISENGSQLETDAEQPAPDGASSTSQAQSTPTGKGRTVPPCRYDDIVKAYHDTLPELPAVRIMDEKRQRSMRRLWHWVFFSRLSDGRPRATTPDEAVAWFRTYFDRARESDFLMGRTPRARGHEGWKCTLDYLLSDRGLKHVVEGLQ